MTDTVHVLGLGGVGVLVAHALAGVSVRPRLNLLLHRPRDHYSGPLAVARNGATTYQSSFTVEEYRNGCWYRMPFHSYAQPARHTQCRERLLNETSIRFLVVAVKAHHTVNSVRLIKNRLSNHSTILFLQNGLGVLDELDAELFPNPRERPYYMSGIVTHCMHRKGFLSAVHTATGSIALGTAPRIDGVLDASVSYKAAPDAERLTGILRQADTLNVSLHDPPALLQQQLIKLAINSFYNPLTALLGCSVKELISLNDPHVQAISDALIGELSDIIRALPLSELIGKKDVETEFSPVGLKKTIYEIGLRAGDHTTSMLQDIKNGAKTEIMYLNGFFLRWGLKLGVDCPVNAMITRLVLEKENRGLEEGSERGLTGS
ncbi:hypothetical protein ASPFODRAFT_213299 [Aspergillus luchuensis CBS 106.47]|uniref:2-dehydropantoate 2-reductase n=1 Tax=Aspergillus luchuensis (strain CBS 106.47) TaxID=1137211 RepID=A0A1M3SYD2_ASPLC|nr:hypothetical protein ASPFODRAFT_213299 [Aspergillus luchuensis CBS 106.47]